MKPILWCALIPFLLLCGCKKDEARELTAEGPAPTAREQARDSLLEELCVSFERTLERGAAEFPGELGQQEVQQKIAEFRTGLPKLVEVFPELEPTEAEAVVLLAQGPDDAANEALLESNMRVIWSSGRPAPSFILLFNGIKQADPEFNGWELEALRRVTDSFVRKYREEGVVR